MGNLSACKYEQEMNEIISEIDNRQGDLTRRVTITNNKEVASVGGGINAFMAKLQEIFRMISSNSRDLEGVVNEVRECADFQRKCIRSVRTDGRTFCNDAGYFRQCFTD